jgi:AAA+ superfamily predicted ATPase
MMHIADDLIDRMDWVSASVGLLTASDETAVREYFTKLAVLQTNIQRRATQHDVPFARLASRFSLSESEVQVIALLAAMRIHPPTRELVQRHVAATELSIDAIRMLVYGTQIALHTHDELSSYGTLRRFALIERNDNGGAASHESKHTWTITSRVLSLLHGENEIDRSLSRVCSRRDVLPLCDVATGIDALELGKTSLAANVVVIAAGMPGLGRRTFLTSAASDAGCNVLEIDARRLSKDALGAAAQLRAIARECRLLARVPLIANLEGEDERMELIGSELVANIEGPVLVTTTVQRPRIDWGRPVIVIEMQQPTTSQRTVLWKRALGEIGDVDADHLATNYPLAPALIARAAEAAKARASGRKLEAADVHAGIRAVLDDRLGQYAKRVTVTQTWEDLVLPREQVETITELMARIRERRRVYEDWGFAAKVGKGLGVSALFSGPPGTGKTMVAALIAKDLGLELYQVDLGKVVSKYIGETEKNLAALFDAAEAGHAVLLFDEADALFGKRTEVRSSNDRYANLETNYLLQRLESFTGICLLTSNHETNIDPAFLRRLSLHLRFELPDVEERAQLWRAMLPKAAPVAAGVDVQSLARRYAMSGGYIRNAALRAAFLAANDDGAITATHLERAARSEYEGMGKIATL